MVPLWPLIFLMASIAPVVGGFVEGGKIGLSGRGIGFAVGLLVGTGWFFGLLAFRRGTLRIIDRLKGAWGEVVASLMYIIAFASGLVATYIAVQITRFVMHRGFV